MGTKPTTFTELENELLASGIAAGAMAINCIPVDGQHCIQWDGKLVEVFYSERGIKLDLETFDDPVSAIRLFKTRVLADRSAYALSKKQR